MTNRALQQETDFTITTIPLVEHGFEDHAFLITVDWHQKQIEYAKLRVTDFVKTLLRRRRMRAVKIDGKRLAILGCTFGSFYVGEFAGDLARVAEIDLKILSGQSREVFPRQFFKHLHPQS